VPYNVLVQRIGKETLRSEAVEEMLNPVFEEALSEIDVAPYSQAQLDDVQSEPLVLSFTIPLQPVVTLGDYRALRHEIEEVEVTDEAVEEGLEHIRTHHQVLEPVNRPAMSGDVVTLSGTGEILEEDATEVIFDEERAEILLDDETTFAGTTFVENLIGMEVGDNGDFKITFPEDYEDEELAGKEASFSVTILDVKSRYLPELNDDLAKEEGDFETLEELRASVREDLQRQAEAEAKNELYDTMMDEMLEDAELVYPPVVVQNELNGMLENLKQQATQAGWEWNDFLMLQGETESSLQEKWREQAEDRVRHSLVLGQFIEEEKLQVSIEDLDAAIDARLEGIDENEELRGQMRDFFRQGQGLEMLSSELVMNNVYERLEAIAIGEAPDLAALEEEADADKEAVADGAAVADAAAVADDEEE
jgi:trigger factor